MKLFKKFHKKGFALPLEELIGMILSVVTVLGTLALFIALMGIFLNPPSAGSAKTINDFHEFVSALYLPENKNTSCYVYNFFIEENWFIAGMNSDGLTSSTTTDATCGPNEDCIEEMHGPVHYADIEKPASCGTGPCVCLCYIGKSGDPGGDDCSKKGAICEPFPSNIGFERFYRYSKSYCSTCHSIAGKCITGKRRERCDLVYDGEKQGGGAKGLQYGTTFTKSGNHLDFMFVDSEAERESASKVRCREMVRDLKKKKAPENKKLVTTSKPKGDQVTKALDGVKTS